MASSALKAQRHRRFRHLAENPSLPISSRDRDELLRRVRALEALEERALGAYERGDHTLAERLDAEYAEAVEVLEAWTEELLEGTATEELEPEEEDILHLGTPHQRAWGGRVRPVVAYDLTAQLAEMYAEFQRHEGQRHDDFDPHTWEDREGLPFPIVTREDALALRAKNLIEEHFGFKERLDHVPPAELVEAVQDAYERRRELVRRYRGAEKVAENPGQLPRTTEVFNALLDELEDGPFGDLGEVCLAVDRAAGDGGARQYAYCRMTPSTLTIAFAPKAESLSRENLVGLVAHELGHAIDFRYTPDVIIERTGLHDLAAGAEQRADQLAAEALGVRIEYDANDVQCVGCGGVSPRPAHLAQNPAPVRGTAEELFRDVVRVGDRSYPIRYAVRLYGEEGEDGYAIRARVADPQAPPPPLPEQHTRWDVKERQRWPEVGSVSVEVRDYGDGEMMAVYSAKVMRDFQRRGIGSRLYELAYQIACERLGMHFASDVSRSEKAERRWEAQGAELREAEYVTYGRDGETEEPEYEIDYYLLRCPRARGRRFR